VQSRAEQSNDTIEVDGLFFNIESNLKRFIPIYGNLVVDFKKAFFGEGFSVRFSGQGSC
jgi:hypothetical protein